MGPLPMLDEVTLDSMYIPHFFSLLIRVKSCQSNNNKKGLIAGLGSPFIAFSEIRLCPLLSFAWAVQGPRDSGQKENCRHACAAAAEYPIAKYS